MAQIKEYGVFKDYGKAKWEGKTIINAPFRYQKIRVHFVLQLNTVENLREIGC